MPMVDGHFIQRALIYAKTAVKNIRTDMMLYVANTFADFNEFTKSGPLIYLITLNPLIFYMLIFDFSCSVDFFRVDWLYF
jgi:hypothetical protein